MLPQINGSAGYTRALQSQFAAISEQFPDTSSGGGGLEGSPLAQIFAAPNTFVLTLQATQNLWTAGRVSAAREGARVAAVTNPDVDLVTARVNEVLDGAHVTGSGVNVEGPLGAGTNRTVRVTVTAEFEVLSGTILEDFTGTLDLQGVSVMRFEG